MDEYKKALIIIFGMELAAITVIVAVLVWGATHSGC